MSRKKPTAKVETLLFNVLYEDGTLTSNRKIPATVLSPFDKDGSIREALEAQDREIETRSGRSRGPIKTITAVD
jgi:hypothetical protein